MLSASRGPSMTRVPVLALIAVSAGLLRPPFAVSLTKTTSAGMSILEATNITNSQSGVSYIRGKCANDRAYKLDETAFLTMQTSQIFPEFEDFPMDFSIQTDIRIDQGSHTNTVFLIYNEAGEEQLGLTVGNDIVLEYNGIGAHEEQKKTNTI